MPIYLGAGVAYLAFMGMAWFTAKYLNFEGETMILFMTLLGVVGLTGTALFVWLQSKWESRGQGGDAGAGGGGGEGVGGGPAAESAEVDQILKEAEAKLAAARLAQGSTIANLPLVFIIGDQATAKTSTVMNSGLDPELLAGGVYADASNQIAPTRGANFWYARATAFVEAGAPLLADASKWQTLVKKLRPGNLKTIVGKGTQAPRAVVLCFDMEAFLRQGASEQLSATARYLQARLGEISQFLGISFPVYVLFTKCDRLPFFVDYVRNLTNEEASQVFGVTMPIRQNQGGVYADEETARLTNAFNNLFYSLCDKRIVFLPRENEMDKVPGAYEFPREFRKLRTMLVQLLVDVCRPSQLRSSPFLRGFYFTGVRPVVITDVAPAASPTQSPQQSLQEAGGATRMFRVGMEQQRLAQQASASAQGPTARKVPQWVFLGHLFNSLILQDANAMAASGSSTKTSTARRLLLGTLAALCLLYSAMLVISFFGNRALEQEAIQAAQNINSSEGTGATIPSEDALKRLDTLRASLEKLTVYHVDRPWFRLGWGLYIGDDIYQPVRRIYYNKFFQVLFGGTQSGMLAYMQKVPPSPSPTDDYGYGYNTLKGYLLTTSEWQRTSDKSLQSYLASLLRERWVAGRDQDIGGPRMALAKTQFDFYAKDLINGNPFPDKADAEAVERARAYLWNFGGIDSAYQAMLAEANKKKPPTNFNQAFAGTAEVVTSTKDVAFPFTKDGYIFMDQLIRNANFEGEKWVLGPERGTRPDKAALMAGVRDRYIKDYIANWRAVLKASSVNKYKDLRDASAKLQKLTGNQAPLLNLMWWASNNTNVGVQAISDAFKSVQMVEPPSNVPQFVVDPVRPYNSGLQGLQAQVDQAANMPAVDPPTERSVRDSANSAKLTTRGLTSSFPVDPEAKIQETVETLLLQPITYTEAMIKGKGSGEVNAAAGAFCNGFRVLTNKFPFNPTATPEVTLQELADFMRPKDGKLWVLYESNVKNFVQCNAMGDCVANPASPAPVNPAFIRFFSQAVKFSKALYGESGAEPNFNYTLRPKGPQVGSFIFKINDQSSTIPSGGQKSFVWPGPGNRSIRVSLVRAGESSPLEVWTYDGLWSVFRYFADADHTGGAGNVFSFTPRVGKNANPIQSLAFDLTVDSQGPAVFSKDFLSGLKCVGTVAQ